MSNIFPKPNGYGDPHSWEQWEYREATIPLHLTAAPDTDHEVFHKKYYETIQNYLEAAAQDGWMPDGPVDFDTVFRAGRIRFTVKQRLFGFGSPVYSYVEAYIYLKRLK